MIVSGKLLPLRVEPEDLKGLKPSFWDSKVKSVLNCESTYDKNQVFHLYILKKYSTQCKIRAKLPYV